MLTIRYQRFSLLVAALVISGCGGGEEDPSASAVSAVGPAVDMAFALDGFGPDGAQLSGGFGVPAALHCDAEPDIVAGSACGHPAAVGAHFEWTGCALGGPQGGPPGEATGSLDITRSAPEICGPGAEVLESAVFQVERALPNGRILTIDGAADSAISGGQGSLVRSVSLLVSREVHDEDGELLRSMSLSGELEISASGDDGAPSRTMNGTLTATFGNGHQGTIEMEDVVRVPPSVCFWPIAGTVTRTAGDGSVHTLVLGPECGEGTQDGIEVDLSSMQGHKGRFGQSP